MKFEVCHHDEGRANRGYAADVAHALVLAADCHHQAGTPLQPRAPRGEFCSRSCSYGLWLVQKCEITMDV